MLENLAYVGMTIWLLMGVFMFYTIVRDDIRNEKERKEKE